MKFFHNVPILFVSGTDKIRAASSGASTKNHRKAFVRAVLVDDSLSHDTLFFLSKQERDLDRIALRRDLFRNIFMNILE
ncbi:MAG: hypothetical protein PHS41_05495 [Victivallaceae bacterium]|nr:hypothetical protein [Victivallaceae bacterium]